VHARRPYPRPVQVQAEQQPLRDIDVDGCARGQDVPGRTDADGPGQRVAVVLVAEVDDQVDRFRHLFLADCVQDAISEPGAAWRRAVADRYFDGRRHRECRPPSYGILIEKLVLRGEVDVAEAEGIGQGGAGFAIDEDDWKVDVELEVPSGTEL